MEIVLKSLGLAVFTFAIAGVIAVLTAWPVELIWNDIVPEIFGLKEITFMQALMLSVLCGLLFKSNNTSSKEK